jgi:protein-S-isoprenylcysteine O-methyltransferase Ste14
MFNYEIVILICWAALIFVWVVGAFTAKSDIKGAGILFSWSRSWLLRLVGVVLVVLAVWSIATGRAPFKNFSRAFSRAILFTPPLWLGWLGAILVVLGVGFAIWARFYLGRNWSAAVVMKEHHELITGGPYALVRHPIYAGVILAAFGFALTGAYYGLALFVIAPIMLYPRLGKEERLMHELFPDAYSAYRSRTKRFIPFVW